VTAERFEVTDSHNPSDPTLTTDFACFAQIQKDSLGAIDADACSVGGND
jgi:hypothetical protein